MVLMDEPKPYMRSIMERLSAPLWILGALIAFIVNELTVVIKKNLKHNIQYTSGSRGCIVRPYDELCPGSFSMWLYGKKKQRGN